MTLDGPTRRSCGSDPAELSAFVDHALDLTTRQRVLDHLTDCASCADEVAELRRLRALLGTRPGAADPTVPGALSARLVDIAGRQADQPLWTRPFDRSAGDARLPMRHRARRIRAAAVSLGCVLLLTAVSTAGWIAAPQAPVQAAEAVDRTEDSMLATAAALPMSSIALLAIGLDGVQLASGSPARASTVACSNPLDALEARLLLQRSIVSSALWSHTGVQQVSIRQSDGSWGRATVRINAQPGQGTAVEVASGGRVHATSTLPDGPGDGTLAALVATRNTLSGCLHETTIAGRSASLLQVTESDGALARWWIDEESGALLRTERFDDRGGLRASAGYVDIALGHDQQLPVSAQLMTTTRGSTPLTQVASLRAAGWSCADDLGGLSLVDVGGGSGALTASYSDGVSTASVNEQTGTLTAGTVESLQEAGFVLSGQAWIRTSGAVHQAVWQSGDRVIVVVADADPTRFQQVLDDLPHEPVPTAGATHRIASGWQHIVDVVGGR